MVDILFWRPKKEIRTLTILTNSWINKQNLGKTYSSEEISGQEMLECNEHKMITLLKTGVNIS